MVVIHESTPPMLPGNCKVCGSVGGDGRKFIDTTWHIKKYGRVYFCEICFAEINSAIGWVGPVNFQKAVEEVAQLTEELESLKEENAKLRYLVSDRLPQLFGDISTLFEKPAPPKRSPGRPPKNQSGTSE